MKLPRPVLLLAFLLVPLALLAQSGAPAALLGSTVFKWEDFKAKPTGNGERRDVTDRPTATFEVFESHISTLLPGKMSHPPHQHAREEFIILREGTLDVSINGVITRAGPGSLLFFASNDFHNVTNVGDTPATYFVFNFSTAATKYAPKEGAEAAKAPGKLGSRVFDWAKLEFKPGKTGGKREVVDSPTTTLDKFECHVTTLNAHEAPHEAHHHPDEEIVFIKEGALDVTLKGVTTRANAGSIVFVGSNDEHGWRNALDTATTYYVFRILTGATPKSSGKL
ncbi:MAG TPA: cupin domain-containing protein [Lacunisphaera sp.]